MVFRIQKLFVDGVKQDLCDGLSQSQIASKYGVLPPTVSQFCSRNNLKIPWEDSNSQGVLGEKLFSRLFEYDINFNDSKSNSEFDFKSQALGNIDVKFSSLITKK